MQFIQSYFLNDLSICDKIIDWSESQSQWYEGAVGTQEKTGAIDIGTKDCWQLNLEFNTQLFDEYNKNFVDCVEEYKNKFKFVDEYSPWGFTESPNIQKYLPPNQGFHGWHCERAAGCFPYSTRHLVFMTYLNDVNDGGETEFYYQDLKIKPEKGKTVIWPADWTHTHRGLPPKSNSKYIVTGWLNYLQ